VGRKENDGLREKKITSLFLVQGGILKGRTNVEREGNQNGNHRDDTVRPSGKGGVGREKGVLTRERSFEVRFNKSGLEREVLKI